MSLLDNCRALVRLDYDPDQPRDESGRWGEGGSGGKVTKFEHAAIANAIDTAKRIHPSQHSAIDANAHIVAHNEARGFAATRAEHVKQSDETIAGLHRERDAKLAVIQADPKRESYRESALANTARDYNDRITQHEKWRAKSLKEHKAYTALADRIEKHGLPK